MEESGSGDENISLDESIVYNNTCLDDLKHIRIKNIHRVVIGQININSLRNKFDFLSSLISGNIDILLITETKLDNSFPEAQFHTEGFASPYRLDRNANGGGILLYVFVQLIDLKPLSDVSNTLVLQLCKSIHKHENYNFFAQSRCANKWLCKIIIFSRILLCEN